MSNALGNLSCLGIKRWRDNHNNFWIWIESARLNHYRSSIYTYVLSADTDSAIVPFCGRQRTFNSRTATAIGGRNALACSKHMGGHQTHAHAHNNNNSNLTPLLMSAAITTPPTFGGALTLFVSEMLSFWFFGDVGKRKWKKVYCMAAMGSLSRLLRVRLILQDRWSAIKLRVRMRIQHNKMWIIWELHS